MGHSNRQDKQSSEQETELVMVYISSKGIDTVPQITMDENTGESKTTLFVQGSINGEAFKVPCNQPVEVTPDIAAVLQGILARQAGG